MALLNQVNLVGRAGRDPEIRYFETGTVLCTLTLAVDRLRRKGTDEQPDWFDLEIWGKTAEIAGEYVRKGSLLGITGALTFSRWTDKTTQERRERPVIKVDQLELLGSRERRSGDSESFS
ncbi:single-stranded DNA-binding protein [Gloeobacter kilaueensis]|uniref:Single-stranded DNA-binding protein n=1 Tax=Gloeobacter kilaueensis (strain ATCC BAA-2537 / CCAP 1431/1 / ULC 316 / JS1) TaxID=1183438 RepID=U5QLX6_GLOK1|nr:single-stranded DNA-binding protein [Gloeobacter kilaueensis]AGY58619.1 single-stranded DNA-binding protein [Gloeobacter kilaueensis JS1]